LLLYFVPAEAQDSVRYDVSFPDYVHHEVRVRVEFRHVPVGEPLEVRMSRSSPGRYALHEFAKNVYAVEVSDGAGKPARTMRPDPYSWLISGHDGIVVFAYTLFADRADGTYSQIDNTHANLNMPATFAWSPAFSDVPIRVRFSVPDSSWRIASQLYATDDPVIFAAPDLQYFMDSPVEISAFHERSWLVEGPDGAQTVRLVAHHEGDGSDVDSLARLTALLVDEAADVFGGYPKFDDGTYTFLVDALPHASGDGMEHRNSTYVTGSLPLDESLSAYAHTIAHEFVHAWNAERLRPASLEPFDFTRANMSYELWFVEGVTSYYGWLLMRRVGAVTTDMFAAAGITPPIDIVVNSPGRRYFSAAEMSSQAPFRDGAVSVDPDNEDNTFISYYTWGHALALALDLTLRGLETGLTLDDFMRLVWQSHGTSALPYRNEDLKALLGQMTGDQEFADDFFDRFIFGGDVPDYSVLLEQAGLGVEPSHPSRPYLGARVDTRRSRVVVGTRPFKGSPLYEAGLEVGDTILDAAGADVTSADELAERLAQVGDGETVLISYRQRGEVRQGTLVRRPDPGIRVTTFESSGRALDAQAASFREAWLGSR
jgi:predicted metalloprotease with PDZ domain